METITRLSRNLLTILAGLVLLFSLSCSDDPSSPKKDDEDPIPEDVVTIGLDGGTVEKDDISITIPAGAFSENYEISITEAEEDGAFGGNSINVPYKVKGLPIIFNQPIKISLKYSGELTDESFIAIGEPYFDSLAETNSSFYNMIDATDSAGFLHSFLPINNIASKRNSESEIKFIDPFERIMWGVTANKTKKIDNYFLRYPSEHEKYIDRIIEILDGSIKILWDIGIPNALVPDEYLSITTIQEPDVKYKLYPLKKVTVCLNINWETVSKQKFSDLKIAIGQTLLENNVKKYFSELSIDKGSVSMLIDALKIWAETKFTEDKDYLVPTKALYFNKSAMAPFDGLRKTSESYNYALYEGGEGLSSLIEYLVNNESIFGNAGISKLFDEVEFHSDAITALINTVDEQTSVWLHDYFKEYISGNIYDLPNDFFINNAHHEWTIESEEDISKIFDSNNMGKLADLSARIFKIDLDYPEVDASQNMLISMNGPVTEFGLSLVIFGIQDNQTIYLGSAHAQDFEIPNLQEYYDSGMDKFLVVLVNGLGVPPYLGQSDINLTVKVTPKIEAPSCSFDPSLYDQCQISLWVLAEKETTNENGTTSETGTLIYNTQTIDGSFNGNTFTGFFESESVRDTITVTLNDNLNMVESLTRSGVEENIEWQILWEKGYTAKNIPLNCDSQNKFESKGLDVCDKVLKIIYNYTTPIYSTTLTDFSCEEVSSIVVEFSKK